jgi:hypothetical protein
MKKTSQADHNSLSDGLAPVRLAALGTMFFLGASSGRALSIIPTWIPFTLALICGVFMILAFFNWAHGPHGLGSKQEEGDDGSA